MTSTSTIYDRTDPTKGYERHLFRPDRVLQAAEMNEIQTVINTRMREIANGIYRDGDVLRDAQATVDPVTGDTRCTNGAVYLAGAVRGVPPAAFTIRVVGLVTLGIYLRSSVVTELEDPALRNPAAGTRGYQEPGAAREKITVSWGYANDGQAGDFYPVYEVEDGYLRSKEAPPNLDSTTQAIARYDRDSTGGGTYIVSGLALSILADDAGSQVYSLAAGRAQVYGYPITLITSRRLRYDALPDLRRIESEPHLSATAGAQRIDFDRAPATNVNRLQITKQTTAEVVRGIATNGQDALAHTAILSIESITQGATTFHAPADFKLTAGRVDWSPGGAEPAPGSTYSATYRHQLLVQPAALDARGFTVTGAVPGSIVEVSYDQMLPRLDRLCITSEGAFVWVPGVASDSNPQRPPVPGDMLAVATVVQTWDPKRYVLADGVHVVSMTQNASVFDRLDLLAALAAQQRLASDIHTREVGTKKGMFTDPLTDDDMRDAGIPQTAAIVRGELLLPIAGTARQVSADITAPATLPFTHGTALEQLLRTGAMSINPYQSFALLPAEVSLFPAVDRWTDVVDAWASPVTERFTFGTPVAVVGGSSNGSSSSTSTAVRNQLLATTKVAAETLRTIDVAYSIGGCGVGETLAEAIFDGVSVLPAGPAPIANAQGVIAATFKIPPGLPAGTKRFTIATSGGKTGSATFSGQGTVERKTWQQVTSITTTYQSAPAASNMGGSGGAVVGPSSGSQGAPGGASSWDFFWNGITGAGKNQYFNGTLWVDPIAQTFTLPMSTQVSGVDLPFTTKPTTAVRVQIRETTAGVPNQSVLVEAIVQPAAITAGGFTRIVFPAPQILVSNTEYAIVVLCNDAQGALGIAELGQFDAAAQAWITSQPYTIGVLLSSSNARTWTAHQDRDLCFRLLEANYTATSRTVALGKVPVVAATDLLLMAYADRPSSVTYVDYVLTLPDGTTRVVGDGQAVQLPAAITGDVQVAARLGGSADFSPVLFQGTQLVAGVVAPTADYVSRAVPCGASGTVKVILEALVPSGAAFEVQYRGVDAGDEWQTMTAPTQVAANDGFTEFTFTKAGVNEAAVRMRLVLRGTTAARPRLRDLRMLVL